MEGLADGRRNSKIAVMENLAEKMIIKSDDEDEDSASNSPPSESEAADAPLRQSSRKSLKEMLKQPKKNEDDFGIIGSMI